MKKEEHTISIKMKKQIFPSLIATSQKEFDKRYKKVSKLSKTLHLDVMDKKFVKTSSLDFELELPKHNYKVHLMVKNPKEWIQENYTFAKTIVFHLEAVKNPRQIIKLIKSKKRKVGIAINPRTPISKLTPYIKDLDQVTIMTVFPGQYGAKFQKSTLKKIKDLRFKYPKLNIEVDGSMSDKTISETSEAGANLFTSGGYLQKSKDSKKAYKKLEKLI